MSIRTLPITVSQIFCKTILNFKGIVKSIIEPEDNFWSNSLCINGLTHSHLWCTHGMANMTHMDISSIDF